ncbi:MAG TPA: L,D-transpeptidase [Candidatus Angelobacter sp.]|nr:L,D-transpeptidase [Candidatus Angelobacter sp.]
MRRIVAIHVKGGVAVGLWALGALCVAAEVRQPGFWYEQLRRSSDPVIGGSGDRNAQHSNGAGQPENTANESAAQKSPEPAYQNNEVAAEQQAAQSAAAETPAQTTKDSHTRQIIISIPDRRLALLEDGQLIKVYPIAVGAKHTPSPEGDYTIVNHAVNPTYRHDEIEIAPGKDNPLGTRWMGLNLKGYGIHGTNVQSSVGKAASHGCFRMKKKDVEDLYQRVQVGDSVSIRGQRDELTASLFRPETTPDAAATASTSESVIASATAAAAVDGGGQ